MLHIHNGSSTAGTLMEFGFPGEQKALQEALSEGPAPAALSSDEWIQMRAEFLAAAYDLEVEKCAKDLRDQEAWLGEFSEHDEVVLWFEHDLFCQINLIYLLDWFSRRPKANTRLSLICIGEFPGKPDFRGLGELTGEQLASLFDQRHEVTEAELSIAGQAWAAYRSADPGAIARLLEEDTSAMPFLGHALRLHLARFPSVRNGLGRVENTALNLISNGASAFSSLFLEFGRSEPVYGLGDAQFWTALKRIGTGRDPLITIIGLVENAFHKTSFELTETGRRVHAGESDFIDTNGIDLWLGGVHLVDRSLWRWDEDQRSSVPGLRCCDSH